jgi:hypothetical protein
MFHSGIGHCDLSFKRRNYFPTQLVLAGQGMYSQDFFEILFLPNPSAFREQFVVYINPVVRRMLFPPDLNIRSNYH